MKANDFQMKFYMCKIPCSIDVCKYNNSLFFLASVTVILSPIIISINSSFQRAFLHDILRCFVIKAHLPLIQRYRETIQFYQETQNFLYARSIFFIMAMFVYFVLKLTFQHSTVFELINRKHIVLYDSSVHQKGVVNDKILLKILR